MSSKYFEPEGSSSGRWMYIQVRFTRWEAFCCNFSMSSVQYHICIYTRLPGDEPSGSKHVRRRQKFKKKNHINL